MNDSPETDYRPGSTGTEKSVSDALDAARYLAKCGVPLFIAKPARDRTTGEWQPKGGANGCGYWLPEGWQQSVAGESAVDRWEQGDALCAVMGHVLDGIDKDPRSGGDEGRAAMESMVPRVWAKAKTPSGGTHEYVATMNVRSLDKAFTGVDIKAGTSEGLGRGFMFLPPTRRKSKVDGKVRAYTWDVAPDLEELLMIVDLLGSDPSTARLAEHLHSRGGRKAATEVVTTGDRGPDAADLTPFQREYAEAYVDSREAYWRDAFLDALELPEETTDERGRGWELLCTKFVWDLARLVNSPWTGLDEDSAMGVYERVVPDEIENDAKCGGKFGPGVIAKAAAEGAYEPTPWPDFDEIDDADVDACVVDQKGLWVCGKGPFDWVGSFRRPLLHTDADAAVVNQQVRSALLAANEASRVPTIMIVSGLPSIIGYRNIARVRRRNEAYDSAEVCIPETLPATVDVLSGLLPAAARIVRTNRQGDLVPSAVPTQAIKAMLTSGDLPAFPVVKSVGTVPIVSLAGTILSEPGYYAAPDYHLITEDMETVWRDVSDEPTAEEVREALALFDTLLDGFPFEGGASRANALAYLLTPPLRAHFGLCPVFVFDATLSQTGKTLLASLSMIIWLGAANTTTMPGTREEMRKTLFAQLLGGTSQIIWDNIDSTVDSGPLASVITSESVSDRILGVSKTATIANDAIHSMTGNKMQVSGEMANRSVRIRLDAHDANPELRGDFKIELPTWAFNHRSDLVWAAHTLIRSWWAAGKPEGSTGQLGSGSSFAGWAGLLGGVLSHAGVEGFMSDYSERDDFVMEDGVTETTILARVLNGQKGWLSAKQIHDLGTGHGFGQSDEEFVDFFGPMNMKAFGIQLRKHTGHTFMFRGRRARIVRQEGETPRFRLGVEKTDP